MIPRKRYLDSCRLHCQRRSMACASILASENVSDINLREKQLKMNGREANDIS